VDSRQKILQALKRQIVPQVALPEVIQGDWIEYPDPVAKFIEMVKFAGGSCDCVSDVAQLRQRLESYDEYRRAGRVFSAVEGIPSTVQMDQTEDPHQLADLDFVIYPGQFAVAENGAIWLTDQDLRHRVCFFITQFLVLVIERDKIIHNMHQAYELAKPPQPGFGLFLSGPSKTADIEQSLVIGAHGCRELQVFVI
jgi:L-lactate dehydrogenase complex protein LldG